MGCFKIIKTLFLNLGRLRGVTTPLSVTPSQTERKSNAEDNTSLRGGRGDEHMAIIGSVLIGNMAFDNYLDDVYNSYNNFVREAIHERL
jgi:hypothetical protein